MKQILKLVTGKLNKNWFIFSYYLRWLIVWSLLLTNPTLFTLELEMWKNFLSVYRFGHSEFTTNTLLVPLPFLGEIVGIHPSISFLFLGCNDKISVPVMFSFYQNKFLQNDQSTKQDSKEECSLFGWQQISKLGAFTFWKDKKGFVRVIFARVTALISCTPWHVAFQKKLSIMEL